MRRRGAYQRVCFLGDSLTAGYDASEAAVSFVAIASEAFGEMGADRTASLNRSGGKVEDGVRQALADLSFLPDAVVFQFGENDRPYSGAFRESYGRLMGQFRREGHRPLLAAISVWDPSGDADSRAMNADISSLISEVGGVFVDVTDAAENASNRSEGRDVGWLADPTHTLSDAFHPNDSGHAAIAGALIDALRPFLEAGPVRETALPRARRTAQRRQ